MQFTEFKGQHVLVSGVASGIGAAQAQAFLQQGAQVIGIDLHQPAWTNPHLTFAQVDVSKSADVKAFAQQVTTPIDILLNTAGILDGYAPTLETDEALWDRIINTNLKSMYLLTNAFLPGMLVQKHGVIINMASIAGLIAGGGGAAYTAAKHGIVGYTQQVDYDYAGQGIRANAIAPGAIDTPMNKADFAGDAHMAKWVAAQTPAKRWAQPSEVADLTLFLASHHADYLHGDVIPIDGGWLEK
ncbi:oxidoreductase, short chain dehydrogenase reductase family protein [Lactobacillus selangorensis]|uniref:Oxidoreductase, short chain dehydrogenase reductase family protein n=1 Tax=Lactobacillus selangorensis TaxID=81857 RepID=A0A0R2FWD3_9LACO|nr:3-oxoacyl-ACP reductase [Lactobacillus selangorensis]KRN28887.1 oxidoreductase, short chain dehydrogenase reductase family protein [Lactobacillus selangorensis]KRN32703.1 oxidoreductase, short chain dehydrogenase reductase family protein [Lactobacillus selangorensis]